MRISSKGEREKAQGSRRREYYQKRGRCAWRSERERERGEGRQMEGERLNIGKRAQQQRKSACYFEQRSSWEHAL